jgi:hypothetical protein
LILYITAYLSKVRATSIASSAGLGFKIQQYNSADDMLSPNLEGIGLFVQISPPGALICANRVDGTGCLGRWFFIPRTILKISDAQVH